MASVSAENAIYVYFPNPNDGISITLIASLDHLSCVAFQDGLADILAQLSAICSILGI